MNASVLRKKLDKILKAINPIDFLVYKRVPVRTGGDSLTGIGVTVTYTDLLLAPQPLLIPLAQQDTLMSNGTAVVPNGEWLCTVSATAMVRSEIQNPNMTIVMKGNTQDELFIVGFTPAVVKGQDIMFELVLRSKKKI